MSQEGTEITDVVETVSPEQTDADVQQTEPQGQSTESLQAEIKKLQATMTRQGYELGELRQLRKLTDELLLRETKPQEPTDFFSDPDKALSERLANHPTIKRLADSTAKIAQTEMVSRLTQSHPDYTQTLKDEAFIDWVKGSKVRLGLYAEADQNYSYDAADELFSAWSNKKAADSLKEGAKQEARDKALKTARVDTGTSTAGKKTYSRLELMRIKTNDPDAYRSMNVAQLYAEGRVR